MITCSEGAVDEPLGGTAPSASRWLVIEHPGAWGPRVLEDTLAPEVARALTALDPGTKVILARSPGAHPAARGDSRVRVWVSEPRRGAMQTLDLPFSDLVALPGMLDDASLWSADTEPWLGVCTNGRRDRCCAVLGRAAAASGARDHPGRVWEVSHLGGHRFAPTSLLLPHGYLHGRVSDPGAILDTAKSGGLVQRGLRGRSIWAAPVQVAEIAWRTSTGSWGLDDVTSAETAPTGHPDSLQIALTAGGGRTTWMARRRHGPARPESCGADALHAVYWLAEPDRDAMAACP